MNNVVIIFVPVEATQQDLEVALREYFPSLEIDGTKKKAAQPDPRSADELPLWTWFLPNPCPQSGGARECFDAESRLRTR
jgi:hypothetical protein